MIEIASLVEGPVPKVVAAVSTISLYFVCCAVYNIYFHPLAQYPGPKVWTATRFRYIVSIWSGWFHRDIQDLHRIYGDIVRVAPNELSFARVDAWNDIYTNMQGRPAFPKSKLWHEAPLGKPTSLFHAIDPRTHARSRRAMDPAFTEKALRQQEPVIQKHVDHFVAKLDELAAKKANGAIVDIVQWFAFVAFDLVGDLGFGESFGCLETTTLHPWIALVFNSVRAATYIASLRYYPSLSWLLSHCIPKSVMRMQEDHWQFAVGKINKRVAREHDRPDFISAFKRDDDGVKGITLPELYANGSLLIIAGSDTTVNVLSGTVNHLVKNPEKLSNLWKEVRSAFEDETSMTLSSLKSLSYLEAVIKEGLRLCNPVPVGMFRITPPEGGSVSGNWVPGNIFVNVHPLALARSPKIFHEPETFAPERWLGEDCVYANDQHAAVQAFGVGPRSCIGRIFAMAELRLILARLVWRFDLLEVDSEAGRLEWDAQPTYSVVQRQPFEIRLRVRGDKAAISHD